MTTMRTWKSLSRPCQTTTLQSRWISLSESWVLRFCQWQTSASRHLRRAPFAPANEIPPNVNTNHYQCTVGERCINRYRQIIGRLIMGQCLIGASLKFPIYIVPFCNRVLQRWPWSKVGAKVCKGRSTVSGISCPQQHRVKGGRVISDISEPEGRNMVA